MHWVLAGPEHSKHEESQGKQARSGAEYQVLVGQVAIQVLLSSNNGFATEHVIQLLLVRLKHVAQSEWHVLQLSVV